MAKDVVRRFSRKRNLPIGSRSSIPSFPLFKACLHRARQTLRFRQLGTEGNEGNKEFATPNGQFYLEKAEILRSSPRSIRIGGGRQ
jgi:hypothetical protein